MTPESEDFVGAKTLVPPPKPCYKRAWQRHRATGPPRLPGPAVVPPLVPDHSSRCFPMSRFINLEFNDDSNHEFLPGETTPVKDEAYYLAAARTAFENGKFEPGLRLYSKVLEFN